LADFGHTATFRRPFRIAQRWAIAYDGYRSRLLTQEDHRFYDSGVCGDRPIRPIATEHVGFEQNAASRLDKGTQPPEMGQSVPCCGEDNV